MEIEEMGGTGRDEDVQRERAEMGSVVMHASTREVCEAEEKCRQ